MTEGRSTILVLHPTSTDPTNFLQRETSTPPSNERNLTIRHSILI
jgi:hypothetical protein